ncbi:TPA: hypothetical protein ACT2ER_002091 [Streptococcus suis]
MADDTPVEVAEILQSVDYWAKMTKNRQIRGGSMEEYYTELLHKRFVLFEKCGTIESEEAPKFGELTLFFQDGKMTHLIKKETKK